jgi:hypothetical protein
MSWYSKFLTPLLAPRPAPPRQTPPQPAPRIVPPSPVSPLGQYRPPFVPPRNPQYVNPRLPATVNLTPKPPHFPNEGPALEGAANAVQRARAELEMVSSDLRHSFVSVEWLGPDAEQFRRKWSAEQNAMATTSSSLRHLEAVLRQRALDESQRFRIQETML